MSGTPDEAGPSRGKRTLLDRDGDGAFARPSSKRGRHGNHGYPRGAIVCVKVNDFMTFSGLVTWWPGPRLNLILGPNGTGKSSFVCAVCLGLGGRPGVLGRSDDLKDFIRRGQNEGWVEVTLSGGPGRRDHVVRRDMQRIARNARQGHDEGTTGQSSTWKLDGAVAKAEQVKALVLELGIQFENLCQFLPQSKVQNFTGMTATELLEATEQAIGDGTMFRQHEELTEMRDAAKQMDVKRTVTTTALDQLKTLNGRQQRDVEKFQKKEQLEEEIKTVERKKLWLDVSVKTKALQDARKETLDARAALRERQEEVTADDAPTRRKDAACKAAELEVKQSMRDSVPVHKRVLDASNAMKAEQDNLDDLVKELANLGDQSNRRKQEIKKTRKAVADLEAEVARTGQNTNGQGLLPAEVTRLAALNDRRLALQDEIEKLDAKLNEGRQQYNDMEQEVRQLETTAQRYADVKLQQLRRLEARSINITQLYYWVQAHQPGTQQEVFKHHVHGPILMEIHSVDPAHAGSLEQQANRVLSWFVVASREDEIELKKQIGIMRVRDVVAACFDRASDAPLIHPAGPASQMGEYGITHTLDQVFQAPGIVKHVMSNISNIHACYIGTARTDDPAVVQALAARTRVGTLYTPTTRYAFGTSKYNSTAKHSSADPVKQPILLKQGVDGGDEEVQQRQTQQALQQRKEELHTLCTQAKALQQRVEGTKVELQRVKEESTQIRNRGAALLLNRGKLRGRLTANNNKVLQLQATPDPLDQEAAYAANMQTCMDRLVASAGQALFAFTAQSDGARAIMAAQLKQRELEMQKDAMQRASHRARTAVGEAQKVVAQFEAREATAKAAKEYSHQTALEAGGELDAAVRALFQALPTDLGDLQAVLEGLQQEAADIVGNAVDVAAYLERQRKITDVEADLARQVADLAAINVDLARKKDEWLPALETVVETVNQSFGLNLAKMGCAGEVKLLEHEDYDQYAMQIWVKFRPEEDLHLLTASRQSGGERAVCTMLYLIALQGVAQTPFRIVDEINQGMDSLNERKVFSLMVDSSCQPGTPQCFMLTPKLLKNMNFQSPYITVHNIMSGGHLATGMTARINMEEGMFGSRFFDKFPAVGAA